MKRISHVDGWLYVGIAVSGCALNHLGTKDAIELISPAYLFFLKLYADALGAACLAAKTYRSTTYADSKNQSPASPLGPKPGESSPAGTSAGGGVQT